MIPLTLVSGTVEALRNITNATRLECMLVALACPVMRVVRHHSGGVRFQGHTANSLQGFNSFATHSIPRSAMLTPYFVVVQRGFDGEVKEARVQHNVVLRLTQYLIVNNSLYSNCTLDYSSLKSFPKDGPLKSSIVYIDGENDFTEQICKQCVS